MSIGPVMYAMQTVDGEAGVDKIDNRHSHSLNVARATADSTSTVSKLANIDDLVDFPEGLVAFGGALCMDDVQEWVQRKRAIPIGKVTMRTKHKKPWECQ